MRTVWLRKITVPILSVLLAVGIAEGGARYLENPATPTEATPDPFRFYEFDSVLGWANRPGAFGTFRRREFAYPVRINSHGMRDRERGLEKKDGVTRVAVVGDSHTWGIGVPDAERFTERTESYFARNVEILNFGVTGYSLLQSYLSLDRVLAFRPDVVVLAFCLGNDMVDSVTSPNYGYYSPYATLTENSFAVQGYPLPNVYEFEGRPRRDSKVAKILARYSALYRRWEWKQDIAARLSADARLKGLASLRARDFYEAEARLAPAVRHSLDEAIEINRRILNNFAQRVTEAGSQLVLMATPTKCEFGKCAPGLTDSPNLRQRDRLKQITTELKISYIDIPSSFGIQDFWDEDAHWRASGHLKMAHALAGYLASRLPEKLVNYNAHERISKY